MKNLNRLFAFFLIFISPFTFAADSSPWGGAQARHSNYKPQKVVYDVNISSLKAMNGVLDRASYLSKITGADPFDTSIVLVMHGGEIPFFARENYKKYKELMDRAQSLVDSEVITINMCQLAAEGHGYKPEQIHGFVKMVPMGDAEIIRLQNEENHAYMQ